MNILLSSYSVNPYKGSEDTVGWNWTVTLSRKFPEATIYLLTKKFNKEDTERGIAENKLDNVKLIIKDVPDCLNWFREKHSVFHHGYYMLWQKYAYSWAKKSGIHFDIIHHVTMGNYRFTGKMYKFNDSYTVFGPVAGAQTTPKSLKDYYKNIKNQERFRETVDNLIQKFHINAKALGKFDKVYAVNDETKGTIEKITGKPCLKLAEMSTISSMRNLKIKERGANKKCVEIIYVGRFIEWKGLLFLIDCLSKVKTDRKFRVSLYGSGELIQEMKEKTAFYHLENIVNIPGEVKHTEIAKIYENADIFVHPTLRESGGMVFAEAMANALPIVALNQSFSRDLNENGCGLFVNTTLSKEEIQNQFAQKLTKLIEDDSLREELGKNGYKYANTVLTMDYKFNEIYSNIPVVKQYQKMHGDI